MSGFWDKIDEEIASKSDLDAQIVMSNRREKRAKQNKRAQFFLGDYKKSFGYDYDNPFVPFQVLDAQPFLTPQKLENLDFRYLLQYLFYRLYGGKNNPDNPFKEM